MTEIIINPEIRCTRCILPSGLQGITFDADGVCSYCRAYEKDFKDWDAIAERRKAEFEALIEAARRLSRPYDCVVPLSGGKDSTYALYLCAKVYGLRCLAVNLDNGFQSSPAVRNIRAAVEATDSDLFVIHLNRKKTLRLYGRLIEKTGKFCNVCMRSINQAIESAVRCYHAPLVVKGSGRRVEYVSQIRDLAAPHTGGFMRNVLRGESIEPDYRFMRSGAAKAEFDKMCGAFCDVIGIPRRWIMRFVPQHVAMYDFIYVPYTEIVDIIREEMGWQDASGTVEHMDCELHDIPQYMITLQLPGVLPETFRNSGLIRQGLMTREEALAIEKESVAAAPPKELDGFLEELGMDHEHFAESVKTSRPVPYQSKTAEGLRKIYHAIRRW